MINKLNINDSLKMNLQLFASSFAVPGSEKENPLLAELAEPETPDDDPQSADPGDEETPADTAPSAPEDAVKDKPVVGEPTQPQDDSFNIKEYLDSFKNEINQQVQNLNQSLEARGQEQDQVSQEELEARMAQENEEFWERLQANPKETVMELAQQIADEKVRPILEKEQQRERMSQINDQIASFEKQHPDLKEYVPDMVRILSENPQMQESPRALELAYKAAKADVLETRLGSAPKSIEDFMKDDEQKKQLLSNEDLRNMFIQDYLAGIDKGSPPSVVGSEKTGGQPSLTPETKPKSIREASKILRKQLDR